MSTLVDILHWVFVVGLVIATISFTVGLFVLVYREIRRRRRSRMIPERVSE